MKKVTNKLRVVHFPQVGSKAGFFEVAVKDEEQAAFTMNLLANQHLWLFENKIIPDYANIISVEMYDENKDGNGFVNQPLSALSFTPYMSTMCGIEIEISQIDYSSGAFQNIGILGNIWFEDWMVVDEAVNSAEFTASLSPINANKTNIITVNPLLCSVDWNQYRFDLIKAVLPALVQGDNSAAHCAKKSIEIADEVIKLLKDEKNISDGIQ